MPVTTPKSPELLQAQVATFATEKVEQYQDRSHILNNLGLLATSSVVRAEDTELLFSVPSGTTEPSEVASAYTDFLRSVGGSQYDAIKARADMLTRYEQSFRPLVVGISEHVSGLRPAMRETHPAFIGSGLNSSVFRISHAGKDFAVRIPNSTEPDVPTIDQHLAGAVLGQGIPHLEQIVAASFGDGVTVAEIMPGKEMDERMTLDDIASITDDQLSELVDTLTAASERGIEIDPKPTNILYDREAGFGIIDYASSKMAAKNSASQDLGTIVGIMAVPIMNAGFYGRNRLELTANDYAEDAKRQSANLDVLKRFRNIVDKKLQGKVRDIAMLSINAEIAKGQQVLLEFQDPSYITNKLAEDQWLRERLARQAKRPAVEGWTRVDAERV